jgi:hypothetical protein
VERQFVVQLENRPGELAAVARALACRGINITHISCVGVGSVSSCFLTTDREDETREILSGLGHAYIEGMPLVVDVADEPGGLASVAEKLAAAGVNILGTLVIGRRAGAVKLAFAVDDYDRAQAALREAEPAGVA